MEVKVAFVLDATASMGPWIQAAKDQVVDMMTDIKAEHPNVNIQVALVAYRDYGDRRRFETTKFTTAEAIENALKYIYPVGGDDIAEDVAGALVQASELSWADADVRMIVHIADAPAHGQRFHNTDVSDRFPDGDPDGWDLEGVVTSLAEEDIEYTFVKITSTTDTMVDVFRSVYGNDSKFQVIDLRPQQYDGSLGDPENSMPSLLSRGVSRAVTLSITQSISSQGM